MLYCIILLFAIMNCSIYFPTMCEQVVFRRVSGVSLVREVCCVQKYNRYPPLYCSVYLSLGDISYQL